MAAEARGVSTRQCGTSAPRALDFEGGSRGPHGRPRAAGGAINRSLQSRLFIQGTEPEVVEERIRPSGQLVTIVEFPDMQRAKGWYPSARYMKAIAVRRWALKLRVLSRDGKSG